MERLQEVMEILDKMNFFQGQRAGRELWNDKPIEVQEEDLENFKRDINTIGSYIWDIVKELKQYRDAEEQGLLLRLPCKVGDTAYYVHREYLEDIDKWINTIDEVEVDSFVININIFANVSLYVCGERFGKTLTPYKTLFFTKEEAEQALAKMKEV
jgi:hypothetical protein